MINLFEFAAKDESLKYLAQLFGNMSGAIPIPSGGGDYSPGTVLGAMFQTFNSVILAVGALVVVYTTVVGVMKTAHEGEFMGKNWNNLWIPIRTVLGITCLVPSSSGFSAIQWVLMWIIVQGIGAADTLWTTVLKYVSVTGSPYTSLSIPTVTVRQSMNQLFESITCDEAARRSYDNPFPNDDGVGNYYCKDHSGGFCNSSTDFVPTSPLMSFGPGGACGVMLHCLEATSCTSDNSDTGQIKCLACKGQLTALQNIIPTLRAVASQFVDADYQYTRFWASTLFVFGGNRPTPPTFIQNYCSANNITNCSGLFLPPAGIATQNLNKSAITNIVWPYGLKATIGDTSFMNTSVTFYAAGIGDAVNAFIKQKMADPNTIVNNDLQDAQDSGWIFAGAYYYTIAQMTGSNLEASMPTFTVIASDPQTKSDNAMHNNRSDFGAAGNLISAASGFSTDSAFESSVEGGGKISESISSAMDSASQGFSQNVSGGGGSNPLSELAITGKIFIVVAQALVGAIIIVTGILASLGFFDVYVLGTGVENPVGPTVATLYMLLVPILLTLVGTLITFGGLLSIYLPMVPYVIFTFGAISWLLSTIEAMVAGPLVALGILSPSGQHELMGKSEPAIMMIFYIFLKPSLMIFGLMSAMLLVWVVQGMINAAYFKIVAVSMWKTALTDPVSIILVIGSYVFLIIAAYNKCFQAIYLIPNQVMAWIGAPHAAREGGEAQSLGEVKEGHGKVAGGAAEGTKGAGEAHKGYHEKGAKAKQDHADLSGKNAGFKLTGAGKVKKE